MRCVLRDQDPFLYICSWLRVDFVGECEGAEDFAGDFEEDFRGEEGEDEVVLVFFLGEDLLKRPIE